MADIMRTVKKKFENVVIDRKIKEFEDSDTGQLIGGKNTLDQMAYASAKVGEKLGVTTKNITQTTDIKDKRRGATKGDQPTNDVYMDSILRMAGKDPNFVFSKFSLGSTFSIGADPPELGQGSKEVGLIVTHFLLSLLLTVAIAFPA